MFADETSPSDETVTADETDSAGADDSDSASTSEDATAFEMPPASFLMLVSMFSTQAMVAMGVIPNPATGKAESQLPLARHFIDLLDVLDKKTKGNLDAEEQTQLDTTLHQLRMAFVEKNRTGSGEGSAEK